MIICKAIATTLLCGLLGAIIGGRLGYGVGRFAPEYYHAVFDAGMVIQRDPSSIGMGLGILQGFPLGVGAGLVLVAILTWREIQLHRKP